MSVGEGVKVELSVVVCAHNEEEHLPEQLDALLSQNWAGEWELIVVDNRSTDHTPQVAAHYARIDPRVRLESASERPGPSYAKNVGAHTARGERLAFCDADDIVAPGWLEAIARGLEEHHVVTGPHELDLLNPPWLARSRGDSAHNPVGSFFGIFPAIRGANWAIRREVWNALGGLREDYQAQEDTEFSLRCWLKGIEIGGLPEATVHYRYRSNARALWRQGFSYGRYRPRIARLLVEVGQPRPPRVAGWKSWAQLVLQLPSLRRAEGRALYAWIAGNRMGQIIGSIRERTVML